MLRAVNLGEDTDTTGAVTGALAALAWGADAIPREWLQELRGRERIDRAATALGRRLTARDPAL